MEKQFSGWSRNKFVNCKFFEPKSLEELKSLSKRKIIPRGMGRSYGDSSLKRKSILSTKKINKIIRLDLKRKIIEVEAGISIEDLLKIIIPKNLFLPVTPGSKYISIGGMVASDVHGKNHHKKGSFRHHIIELKIIDEKGKLHKCSKKNNKNLFNYSIGGMGLTGIIYSCKFKLISINSDKIFQEKIKTSNLKETIKKLRQSDNWEYNVGWIDTSVDHSKLGRAIIFRGKHLTQTKKDNLKYKENSTFSLNTIFPSWFMNFLSIKVLNYLYYMLNFQNKSNVNINEYFYQLDKVKNWNLIYGKKGFISYQLVIPEKNSHVAIEKILKTLIENKCYSFVSVIKYLGFNDGFNSFGIKGFTLVFDFPLYRNIDLILRKIDQIVIKYGGRIYLCKDSLTNASDFKKMNTGFENSDFKKIRKIKKRFFNSEQSNRLQI